jgi:preprotein translocase subunit YajC
MHTAFMSSFFFAQAAAASGSGSFFGPGGPGFMLILMGLMFFFIIRGNSKRAREQESLQKGLKPGDAVITAGGLHGVVTSVKESTVILRVGDNVKLEFEKRAIDKVKKAADVIDA